MANLLDTHTFIWFINGDRALSKNARKAIELENAINYISIASIWEIAIKISLGKLELNAELSAINDQIKLNGFQLLPITTKDALVVSSLPFHHRDPFDRMIISQALNGGFIVISKDESFQLYDLSLLW